MNRLIAIASGKGGVGKTFLAIALSQALAERGRRVLLADGDFGLANLDVQLGLDPALDLGAVLAGRAAPEEAAVSHPAGFSVLPGRSGSGALAGLGEAGAERLLALLRAAPAEEVVLDLGAGIGAAQRRLAAAAGTLLVVVNEEPTSLTDAYAVLKLHARDAASGDSRALVVANNVADAAAGRRAHRALDRACRGFLGRGVALLGVVRRDPRVPAAIRAQTPLLTRHPESPAAREVRALADALLRPAAAPA